MQLAAKSVPALAGVGVRVVVVLEPFLQHLLVPVRYRNLIGRCGDALPHRLHVVDLFFDGELVESRWWDGSRLRHLGEPRRKRSRQSPRF